ncbi:MAG: (2Fe-2S)-binding protein [Phycisphaerales bacterium]|nr:(2Fe-2S)-binding protein [Phycisphaerales bacterium]
MGTTRCDCKNLSFLGLRSYAQRHGISDIQELIRQTGCCTGCGTCRPHLEEFLRTGKLKVGDQSIQIPDWDVRDLSLSRLRMKRKQDRN